MPTPEKFRRLRSKSQMMKGPTDPLTRLRRKRMMSGGYLGLLKTKSEESFDETDRKMMDHELAIAADIQENLMPKKIPQIPGLEITAYYKPCRDIGGDYYDFVEIDKDHLGVVVADVAGKGIPGALVMVEARAFLRSESAKDLDPRAVLSRVNRLLHQDIPRGMFVTMFYIVLDTSKFILNCVSVGHNPLVLWRAATNSCYIVNPNGIALGIDRGPIFERTVREQSVQLMPGDRFVIYTDGVVEAMNEQKQLFGAQRFYRTVKEYASRDSAEFMSMLLKAVEEHQGKAEQNDDITIVTGRMIYNQDTPYPTVA